MQLINTRPIPATATDTPRLTILKTIESMSEETPCFQAILEWKGHRWDISNDGHGGSNRTHPHNFPYKELNAWAASFCEPIPAAYGLPEHPMDWETFTFQCAFDLLEYAKPLHKLCKEYGLKFPLLHSDGSCYLSTNATNHQVSARKTDAGWIFTIINLNNTVNPLIAQQLIRYAK